jgi:hypothetical protein
MRNTLERPIVEETAVEPACAAATTHPPDKDLPPAEIGIGLQRVLADFGRAGDFQGVSVV